MYLCRRCVGFLHARLMPVKAQNWGNLGYVLPLAKLCYLKQPTLRGFPQGYQNLSQRKKEMGQSCGIRCLADQQATPHRQTSDIFEQKKDSNDITTFKNSNLHHIASTQVSFPACETFIDLDAVPCPSPFEEISEQDAIQITVPPGLPPVTFTLRDYVDKSETLQKLVQLGVNLFKLEQRRNVGSMLVRLDFQGDVSPRLFFLKDLGVEDTQLGPLLSKNPFILTESLENLQGRVSYLKSKKFSSEAVAAMVSKAPYLLNFSVERMDNRLGFFQQQLGLSAQKTRDVVTRLPRLLCGSIEPVKENLKVCELQFGFRKNEIQHIVSKVPKVLTANKRKLTQVFDFVHNTMGVPHSLIAKFPQVLNAKFIRIKERHLFLDYLGRAHYEPAHPNYISLQRLVSLPDDVFCTEVALVSLKDFERFQKTL
ncbi:transcription termination factor 3, mitochondrial isoform X1 [Electrophorus electricus]|uniref:Transcription termination factor 3, mitochondrial n=2 Tax=Electrophorus electricus TaxID=8005 RepID=A0A4W4F1Z1_ELEEL|nr:transcription termination factor 3, mitochondrial isoform X1 [Electrophorus electricus]